MKCPECGYEKTKVYGAYRGDRYRKCLKCGNRFKTVEFWVEDDLVKEIHDKRMNVEDAEFEMVRRYG